MINKNEIYRKFTRGKFLSGVFLILIVILLTNTSYAVTGVMSRACNSCGMALPSYQILSNGEIGHTAYYRCTNAQCAAYNQTFVYASSHSLTAKLYSSTQHKVTCNLCSYTVLEAHTDRNGDYKCDKCTYSYKIKEPKKLSYVYNGSTITPFSDTTNIDCTGTPSARNVGTYTCNVTPKTGYIWADGTKGTKTYTWQISKKAITIKAKSQIIQVGESFGVTPDYATCSSLGLSDRLTAITLTSSIGSSAAGTGTIIPSNATISYSGNDVTSNYDIIYSSSSIMVHNLGIDIDLNLVDTTTVDLTDSSTITPIDMHDCNNYSTDVYNSTNHYSVCKLCYERYEKDKAVGNYHTDGSWPIATSEVVQNSSGDYIIVIKNSYSAHSYTSNYWSMGKSTYCQKANHHYYVCDCGYSYIDDTGKSSHSWGSRESGALYMYWHRRACTKCSGRDSGAKCYYYSGNRKVEINCKALTGNNSVTCYDCGRSYSVKCHRVNGSDGKCIYCGDGPFVDYTTTPKCTITKNSDNKSNVEFEVKLARNRNKFSSMQLYHSQALNSAKTAETALSKDSFTGNVLKLKGVFAFRTDMQIEEKISPNIRFYQWLNDGGSIRVHFSFSSGQYGAYLRREYDPPVISDIDENDINTYNGWSTKKEYTITRNGSLLQCCNYFNV